MTSRFPTRARLYEFGLAVTVVAIVSLLLIDRLQQLQEDAERLMVESTVRNINSGLMLKMAWLVTAQRESELPGLARQSPTDWLEQCPPDYQEAEACPPLMTPGLWCWERTTKRLYYQPRLISRLKIDDNMPLLTWTLRWPGAVSEIRPGALRLTPDRSYEWR